VYMRPMLSPPVARSAGTVVAQLIRAVTSALSVMVTARLWNDR